MNKYIKIWIKSGTFFGMIMGVLYSFQSSNIAYGFLGGLFSVMMFGLFTSGLTFYSDKKLKSQGIENGSEKVNQSKTITSKLSLSELNQQIENTVLSIPKARIIEHSDNSFLVKTGITWKSFGEIISIRIKHKGNINKVLISSRPSVKSTIVDYGKNLENITKISIGLQESSNMVQEEPCR